MTLVVESDEYQVNFAKTSTDVKDTILATTTIEPLYPTIGSQEIDQITTASSSMIQAVRAHMFAPENKKRAPTFSATDIAKINHITKANFHYAIKKNPELPKGALKGNRLEFTLEETIQWNVALNPDKRRDPTINCAVTIAVATFKGGVTKTTTSVTLAQGLSLRGYKCLLIDLDPQGSATSLCGVLPDIEVDEGLTVLPLYMGQETSIDYAIRPTYWSGLDLVPASNELHNSEFLIPSRQMREQNFEFWALLDKGLDSVRDAYDVILIDTPPSLSYTTVNAIMAADGMIMPLPPSPLDFASSSQFWSLCNDLIRTITSRNNGTEKKFNFINVLLSKVNNRIGVSSNVRDWIMRSYGSKVMSVEIPLTSIADTASAAFGTVYDIQQSDSIAKALKRAKDAYEEMVEQIERQVLGVWEGVKQKSEGSKK